MIHPEKKLLGVYRVEKKWGIGKFTGTRGWFTDEFLLNLPPGSTKLPKAEPRRDGVDDRKVLEDQDGRNLPFEAKVNAQSTTSPF